MSCVNILTQKLFLYNTGPKLEQKDFSNNAAAYCHFRHHNWHLASGTQRMPKLHVIPEFFALSL